MADGLKLSMCMRKKKQSYSLDKSKYLSIDLGLDNFAAVVDTIGTAFLIARLQRIYSKQGMRYGSKLAKISLKRQHVVDNFLNQAVSLITKHCLNNQIGTIVIGKMKDIKQEINLGRVNNQNFVSIPYDKFKRKLRAKCEEYGIEYIEEDESFTSQMCSRCKVVRKGNRKYRGLYVCKDCGNVMNADINGAINILAKVAGESAAKQIVSSGRVNRPVRIRVV